MKEAKIVTILLFFILVISLVLSFFLYEFSANIYNICISVFTGALVSFVMSLSQYFVKKKAIKDKVFDLYFDVYISIYNAEHRRIIFNYNVKKIYSSICKLGDGLSSELLNYSGFIPNNKLYKKLSPTINLSSNKINAKEIEKLFLPFNYKRFNKTVVPFKIKIKDILVNIDRKKFDNKFDEYERVFTLLWK